MPRSASSKRPALRSVAPVNAPRSWPNSSLSMSDSVRAAQLTATSGPRARRLAWWMASATISLPAPDSPPSNTVASAGPTRATKSRTRRAASLVPMKPALPPCCSSRSSTAALPRASSSWAAAPTSAAPTRLPMTAAAIASSASQAIGPGVRSSHNMPGVGPGTGTAITARGPPSLPGASANALPWSMTRSRTAGGTSRRPPPGSCAGTAAACTTSAPPPRSTNARSAPSASRAATQAARAARYLAALAGFGDGLAELAGSDAVARPSPCAAAGEVASATSWRDATSSVTPALRGALGASITKRSRDAPMRSSSPCASARWLTTSSLTWVRGPGSSTTSAIAPPRNSSRACTRDTVGSVRGTSASSARPMSPPRIGTSKLRPWSGPPSTIKRAKATARL